MSYERDIKTRLQQSDRVLKLHFTGIELSSLGLNPT